MRKKELCTAAIRSFPESTEQEDSSDDDLRPDFTLVSRTGDMILEVSDESGKETFYYRVKSSCLRDASAYFANLLGHKFSEGAKLAAAHANLGRLYPSIGVAPLDELPRVAVSDIGRISKVSTIKNIMADFLRVLHGLDLHAPSHSLSPPVQNLANLAIVADRFNALPFFSRYIHRRGFLQTTDGRARVKTAANLSEEKVRQKLMLGLLLDYGPWVTTYSKRLLISGSLRWRDQWMDDPNGALWWDLPFGVEDELIYRRECVLETINSLQSHFTKLYTSGERQCKLGYDSSSQCDSFQLGEMVRFFTRLGTIRLRSTIYDVESPEHYNGDIDRLIDTFRQCPSYQINGHHAHCGLRSRILPLLDLIQNQLSLDTGSLDIGICADCWQHHRAEYAWSEAKRPLMWNRSRLTGVRRGLQQGQQGNCCLARHINIREMFTAVERDWTAKEAY
ncbi:hypothetical protein H2201_005311 [Coniosporium apollinis]|uniref:BTB domain-containing protein n=2 Tax=Coniosporium TaxID=2810619 RepID=A0ABQ9NWM9_9PEZI|nr:hypothetical protein H2199_006890 [Cladosporium sp. JES 115]KAJ9664071.1 hypothetical protein H2201_005311 [Coniosporium apollinis]